MLKLVFVQLYRLVKGEKMKKSLVILLLAGLVLTACGAKETDKKTAASSETSSVSKEKKAPKESSTPESSSEEVEKTEIYKWEEEEDGLRYLFQETVVYKGDEFLRIERHMTRKATEEEKASFAGFDFDMVRTEMLNYLDQEYAEVQQLKSIQGVTFAAEVTPEYDLIVDIHVDMTTVDLDALSKVEGIGSGFEELKDATPSEYTLGLRLIGAELTNP